MLTAEHWQCWWCISGVMIAHVLLQSPKVASHTRISYTWSHSPSAPSSCWTCSSIGMKPSTICTVAATTWVHSSQGSRISSAFDAGQPAHRLQRQWAAGSTAPHQPTHLGGGSQTRRHLRVWSASEAGNSDAGRGPAAGRCRPITSATFISCCSGDMHGQQQPEARGKSTDGTGSGHAPVAPPGPKLAPPCE
jgi:hypothetical protein